MTTIDTKIGIPLNAQIICSYFENLVNHFFKILPMRENEEKSLIIYMQSLQHELMGFKEFIPMTQNNPNYLTLLSILQYLIDTPDCSVVKVKREVFRAISICNKLQSFFMSQKQGGVSE